MCHLKYAGFQNKIAEWVGEKRGITFSNRTKKQQIKTQTHFPLIDTHPPAAVWIPFLKHCYPEDSGK